MSLDPLTAALVAVEDNADLLRGPEGPQGEPGRDGRDGLDGQDGRDGRDGQPGPEGPAGRDGQDGKDGVNGTDGVSGRNGERGPKGDKGEKGDRGIQGPPGSSGRRALPTYIARPGGGDSGGGSSIAATDTQIVFMNGTDPVGSANLTWDDGLGAVTLGLDAREDGNANIVGLGVGTQLTIQAADGDADHVGGEVTLHSGSSDGQNGGQITITAGSDGGGGDGGGIEIDSGSAADGQSGEIDIRVGGSGGNSYRGGGINIVAGTGSGTSGGSVVIQAGAKVTGGSHGHISLYDGSSSYSVGLYPFGVLISGGVVFMGGLPTSDPLSEGQLFTNGAPSAGVPKALMVSGG